MLLDSGQKEKEYHTVASLLTWILGYEPPVVTLGPLGGVSSSCCAPSLHLAFRSVFSREEQPALCDFCNFS
jgi:hypothetical protein